MKVFKVVLYVIDFDEIGAKEAKSVLVNTRYPNRCITPNVASIEEFEIGEWEDEHPLNQIGVDVGAWLAEHAIAQTQSGESD